MLYERINHIEFNCDFVREKTEQRLITTRYITTKDQPAEIFTKGLSKVRNEHLKAQLWLLDIFLPSSLGEC